MNKILFNLLKALNESVTVITLKNGTYHALLSGVDWMGNISSLLRTAVQSAKNHDVDEKDLLLTFLNLLDSVYSRGD